MVLIDHRRLQLLVEMWLPLLCAAATLVACLTLRDAIVSVFVAYKLSLPQLYTAIFGWASVMTGFLFGVYGLIVGKSDGFIEDVRHTRAMQIFLRYTSRAVMLGFIITMASFPFLVANYDMANISKLQFTLNAMYFALFIWGFFATARVAYIFSFIVRVPAVKRLPA